MAFSRRGGHIGRSRMPDDEADPLATPEWHTHTAADLRQWRAGLGDVIERVGEGNRNGDPDQLTG